MRADILSSLYVYQSISGVSISYTTPNSFEPSDPTSLTVQLHVLTKSCFIDSRMLSMLVHLTQPRGHVQRQHHINCVVVALRRLTCVQARRKLPKGVCSIQDRHDTAIVYPPGSPSVHLLEQQALGYLVWCTGEVFRINFVCRAALLASVGDHIVVIDQSTALLLPGDCLHWFV